MLASIAGLPAFLAYLVGAFVLVAVYLAVYSQITAHNELALIRSNIGAAGVSLGLSLIGFVIPLASAMRYSSNVWDMMVWGVIAMIVQVMVYYLVCFVIPDLSKRIEANELGAAMFIGAASLAAGVLNATAMSY